MGALNVASSIGSVLANLKASQYYAAARVWVSMFGGVAVGIGMMTEGQRTTLADALSQFITGLQQIGQGIGTIAVAIGIATPVLMSLYAAYTASSKHLVKAVSDDPIATKEIAQDPKMVAAVADSPAVLQPIQATPEMAAAAPSTNVIPAKT